MLDRKSTRLDSSHTDIYTLSLHDALPILAARSQELNDVVSECISRARRKGFLGDRAIGVLTNVRSEEHTSGLQSHRYLHSFPARRSSDLGGKKPRIERRRKRMHFSSEKERFLRGSCNWRFDQC